MSAKLSSRNWAGKASAGLICGFALALGLSGLFWLYGPVGGSGKLQICMWMMAPIWALVFSFCFLFRDGPRAWAWLGAAALIALVPLAFG